MPMEVGIALTFFHFFYNRRWHFATPSSHLVAQNAIFVTYSDFLTGMLALFSITLYFCQR